MASETFAFYGTLVHSENTSKPMVILKNAVIVIKLKNIIALQSGLDKASAQKIASDLGVPSSSVRILGSGEFLMPGFVDAHIHASQYTNIGVGYHLTLLDWLNKYTFPVESKFSDLEFAQNVYDKVVKRTLQNGTTTACYFATIHVEASLLLAQLMNQYGQRGYVGKVCMNQLHPDNYGETTEVSISSTRNFIEVMKQKYGADNLIGPVVTPRFAISCTNDLMRALASLAKEYDVPIQTHMSENRNEVEHVKSSCGVGEYAEVYESTGLLTEKTILAHCAYSGEDELSIIKKYNCGIVHCPNSNISLFSGAMEVKKVQRHGIKLGLGTDVSGGYSISVLDNLRKSVEVSKLVALRGGSTEKTDSIDHRDAFYLATLGGAEVLGLHKQTGNFEVGKEFDALVVNIASTASPFDTFGDITLEEMVGKFVYCGDDRNITDIYVAGRKILI